MKSLLTLNDVDDEKRIAERGMSDSRKQKPNQPE